MEFKGQLISLSEQISNLDKEVLKTEEATKTSLVLPFFYSVWALTSSIRRK